MQVFTATLNQMLVLFIFMALGFFLNKKRLLPLDDSVVLSKLETYAFVPCLVFSVFYKYCTVENFKQKWTYMLYGAAVMAVLLLLKTDKDIIRVALCATAMPLGLNTVVFPAAYGGDTTPGAGMALVSHLISVITIPVMFSIFI